MKIDTFVIAGLIIVAAAASGYAQGNQSGNLPGQGASPSMVNPHDPDDVGVEVSLGREEVKRQAAGELGVSEAELPLSIQLPIALAERACGQEDFEARANVNRSCTATRYIPEIAEAVRNHPQTSATPEQ